MVLSAYGLLYAVIAFNEEVVFRGGLLDALSRAGGQLWGALGSSALYALVHLESSTLARLFGVFLLGVPLHQARLFSALAALHIGDRVRIGHSAVWQADHALVAEVVVVQTQRGIRDQPACQTMT